MTTHTVDAKGLRLGRVASRAATFLMGKDTPHFARNKVTSVKVSIINVSKLVMPEKKRRDEVRVSYSGYPGGLKTLSLNQVIAKKGYAELVRHAIRGMLPPNKLRAEILKNITITE
ncbi:MAG: hypothetical protein A2836_02595 [Candidatus Taylorbacteria bacterium RIFCSPHIGHO2_01_FULL_45_63]|uniref:50S ribosomal protein L13 n=1 Tax=Candidatus Taylorbacteria bacterium RIFCSPHIGHO2_02_FULL_45_35 TaxID=1802311 RepID=A0A1G2MQS2_9BACT|nr:MAG: hypothetical protein A2836_02595 [Candidatus Taylorbacteria bacterium RIFCSPHIGHO2_01_FULL_45_63]OHA26216.1 MAG: hypothetical protein A3D56_03550 [Candidatus Taylorbacteria bacterium RIFCSPHIGHO2_02_FULL_45_35]OHA32556.1 MAG: hypothetical protein A3A22_04040 [Candidatus Taylorbacteria bacterium RIFCSPLOWO2_01_FULL_45_34b]